MIGASDTLSIVDAINAALDVIITKVPDLARDAARAKVRPNAALKTKRASVLAAEAVTRPGLTDDDRRALTAAITAIEDGTRSEALPPVRITSAQMTRLRDEASEQGLSVSDLIRRKLFGA